MNAELSGGVFCIVADSSYRIKILCDCLDILQYNVLHFKKGQMIFFGKN